MTRSLVIIGAGGHARAGIDVIESIGGYKIIGLIGLAVEVGQKVLDYQVIGTDADLPTMGRLGASAVVMIGQIRTGRVRRAVFERLLQLGFDLPTIISPLAYVSPHACIGSGTMIMHKAMVNSGAKIGCNNIINTAAIVEHDCDVGDHCHISTGAILNGSVRIGNGCFVGSGSIIREERSIGDNCIIGMGLSVRYDIEPGKVFVG